MANERKHGTTDRSEFDDLETRSLVLSEKKEAVRKSYRKRQLVVFLIVTLSSVLMIYREDVAAIFLANRMQSDEMKARARIKRQGTSELKSRFMEVRKNYDALLQEQYGIYSNDTLGKSELLRQFISPSSVSMDRLKRRMKIKIIRAALRPEGLENVTFTWAVGGHSAAAGHGDLFNQSYAAILEDVARPFFTALGIEFRGKSRAMGGTSSGPEVAMCLGEIFGPDLDVLSWDYGMTDGNKNYLYEMYAQRAGVHPTMPSLVTFSGGHKDINVYLESAGMSVFMFKRNTTIFPDSNEVNVAALPPAVQYMSCGGHIEAEDLCKEHKWKTVESCPDPKVGYQTSWHTGWKVHQHIGHLLAGHMVENLYDALSELDPSSMATEIREQSFANDNGMNKSEDTEEGMTPSISDSYLTYLLSLEEKDKENFLASKVPTNYDAILKLKDPELNNIFHRSHSACHTALLPSQARYDGLVTESGNVSTYLKHGRTTYTDEGYGMNSIPEPRGEDDPNPVWLAFQESFRNICKYAEIDFKDMFIVRQEDNWMSMLVPTDAEMEVFSPDQHHRSTLGVVMICTRLFDWGRNPKDHVGIPDITNATSPAGKIVVNGVDATTSTSIVQNFDTCHILEHERGYYFSPTGSGQYEIKIHITAAAGGRLYISSVVVL